MFTNHFYHLVAVTTKSVRIAKNYETGKVTFKEVPLEKPFVAIRVNFGKSEYNKVKKALYETFGENNVAYKRAPYEMLAITLPDGSTDYHKMFTGSGNFSVIYSAENLEKIEALGYADATTKEELAEVKKLLKATPKAEPKKAEPKQQPKNDKVELLKELLAEADKETVALLKAMLMNA